jgi:3-oxoacyl-[acyl-carrier protein] reductase
VALTYRRSDADAEETLRLLREHGQESIAFRGNVSDATHAREVVAALVRDWGGLDILVNNAGATQLLPFALIEEADWQEIFDINAKGTFLFCREAARHMVRARWGKIVNITTFGDGRVVEAPVHFAASKAAVRGFSEALARELGRYGVTVNCLAPGLADAGLSERLPETRRRDYIEQCALGRLGTIAELAEIVVFMVSGDRDFMTGGTVVADGGL